MNEISEFLKRQGLNMKHIKKLMKELDDDKSGSLSKLEIDDKVAAVERDRYRDLVVKFKEVDRDGSGNLEIDELAQVSRVRERKRQKEQRRTRSIKRSRSQLLPSPPSPHTPPCIFKGMASQLKLFLFTKRTRFSHVCSSAFEGLSRLHRDVIRPRGIAQCGVRT